MGAAYIYVVYIRIHLCPDIGRSWVYIFIEQGVDLRLALR